MRNRVVTLAMLIAATSSATHVASGFSRTVARPIEQPSAPKKLLFLTHAALYKHSSLAPAEKAVTELGKSGGFDVTTLEGYKQHSNAKGGDYPQAWTRTFGKGRSFYTALGHRDDIWSNDPVFRAHVLGGIRWAIGLEE